MDYQDFRTIVRCAKEGQVRVVNLQYAEIKGHRIPDNAFFDRNLYYEDKKYLPIRRVILPDDITEIGEASFMGMILQQINIPSALKKLSDYSFEDTRLEGAVVIPEGIAEIPPRCFSLCPKLRKVVLPSTLKTIDMLAFFRAGLEEMALPEGLDSIGQLGIYDTNIREIIIPNSVKKVGTGAFMHNSKMKRIVFPSGWTSLPDRVCSSCAILEEAEIPETVTTIGHHAFSQCFKLKHTSLPPNLERIGHRAFYYYTPDSLVLPATVKYLGGLALGKLYHLKKIYSLSPEPPDCNNVTQLEPDHHTFLSTIPVETPVYVPYGAADKYRNASGWRDFVNIIETNRFPTSIVSVGADHAGRYRVYGIDGRLFMEDAGISSEAVAYSIFTMEGKLVGRGTFIQSYTQGGLPRGAYIVRVGKSVHKILL